MNRRRFLQTISSATLLGTAPAWSSTPKSAAQMFQEAIVREPWLAAYQSVQHLAYDSKVKFSGKLPDALRGILYRNGPAQREIAGYRYNHWFEGNGMVHAYTMGDGQLTHRARMVKTNKYQSEQAAGRALYPDFASVPPNPMPVNSADAVNSANISVLKHHGKLFALWEAGSAWEMDPETLESKGAFAFSDDTAGVAFSAHPRVEPDGTLWNFGYLSRQKLLVLWHIAADGRLVRAGTLPVNPITMPHDFVVTENYIVIMFPPFHYRPDEQGQSFLQSHRWSPSDPTRVLVVDKNDFSAYRWLELPAQWVFHFGNAWEDKHGVIQFDGARYESPATMTDLFSDTLYRQQFKSIPSVHYRYRINTKNWTAEETPMLSPGFSTEFPVIDPQVNGQQNNRLVFLHRREGDVAMHPLLNGVSTYLAKQDRLDSFRYPDQLLPEEHLFIPKPGAPPETEGWIVGTALDYVSAATILNVFDANALEAGPIAQARLPYRLPLGLHGKFYS